MAFRWRIRYKLMLGLGLVVGIIVLLLAGTIYGLACFRATMKSIDSKLVELRAAENFKAAVNTLKTPPDLDGGAADERLRLENAIRSAEQALNDYQEKLDDTLIRKRDPDKGFRERGQVDALRVSFVALRRAVAEASRPKAGQSEALLDDPRVQKVIGDLQRTAGDLRDAIYQDMYERSRDAREYYMTSFWTVVSISLAGVALLCGLLRFFYGWVFYPIRDLEQGAKRLAQGDFEYRIDIRSGDEMEDLAAAFDNMTSRLREMYRDLERQVNEKSRQLVRSERLVSVGFLAAGVAHEINNPLASIAFCSEALKQRLADLLKPMPPGDHAPRTTHHAPRTTHHADWEVIAKYLDMIHQEAFRCKGITEKLLDFSRKGKGGREQTDLREVIQAALDMVEQLPVRKGKQIIFKPTGPVIAWVNAHEIESVVLNLVVNALDSTADGGTLQITLAPKEGVASLVFADNGCGMTPEVLENIFEPFYTRNRTGRGTGLGLSISHLIISQHGGEIEAVSAGPNQGSTFTVQIPLRPPVTVKEEMRGHIAA